MSFQASHCPRWSPPQNTPIFLLIKYFYHVINPLKKVFITPSFFILEVLQTELLKKNLTQKSNPIFRNKHFILGLIILNNCLGCLRKRFTQKSEFYPHFNLNFDQKSPAGPVLGHKNILQGQFSEKCPGRN